MEIRNKIQALVQQGRARLQENWRRWLPYAAIALFLGAVWFLWDDTTAHDQITGEMKHSQEAASPSFCAEKRGSSDGRLVCSVSKNQRHKALPDLFAALPEKAALPAAGTGAAPVEPKAARAAKARPVPTVAGYMEEGGRCLLLLSCQGQSAACAVGETFAGWRVAYINDAVAGLEQDGTVIEITLTKGF